MAAYEYWVYDNHHRNRGRIHRGSCADCNFGKGKNGTLRRSVDRWIGFADKESAFAAAEKLKRADMKVCPKCEP